MADQVREQVASPAHAPFQERKSESREAPHDPAHYQSLREGMVGGGKVPDMVVGEAIHRLAPTPTHAAGMTGDCDLQLRTLGPEGVVVVGAVQRERIDVIRHLRYVSGIA